MLNAANKNIALAIANAYCSNNELCKTSLFNRLNNIFTDSEFVSFLGSLPIKTYKLGRFQTRPVSGIQSHLIDVDLIYSDVITGTNQTFTKRVPKIVFNNYNNEQKLFLIKSNFSFIKSDPGGILFSIPGVGYNIAYVVDPISGGGSTSGGGYYPGAAGHWENGTWYPDTTGGGSIIINDPLKNPINGNPKTVIPVKEVFTMDLQKFLIPGLIVVAGFLYLKK
jgi:hypothetical protein